MCNKLFIIGNGFDRAHGMHSSYENFASFCEKRYSKLYKSINNEFKNISQDSLWSNFEEGLGTPDIEILKTNYNEFCSSTRDYEIGTNISDLKFAMKEWICLLKSEIPMLHSKDEFCALFSKSDKFLSFNYTDTLEKLYSIPPDNILHIHGYVDSNDIDLHETFVGYLFGHNLNENEIKKVIPNNDNMSCRIRDHIALFRKRGHGEPDTMIELKDFLSTIEPSDIFILGHSLGCVDKEYFKFINNHFQKARWWISYHEDECKMITAFNNLELNTSKVSFFSL